MNTRVEQQTDSLIRYEFLYRKAFLLSFFMYVK